MENMHTDVRVYRVKGQAFFVSHLICVTVLLLKMCLSSYVKKISY